MARKAGGLIGIDAVVAGLNNRLAKMTVRSTAGMMEAVAFIRADMERKPPLIPVDTGNLRASWFNEFIQDAKTGNVGVVFGFNANYAYWVHENINPGVKWNRPESGPKFLQAALNRNHKEILTIIGRSVK